MRAYDELLARESNFTPAKKNKKKIAGATIYYVIGIVLSFFFILPLLYMFAASTKSKEAIAFSNGSLAMFIPDFTNLNAFFDNYKIIFGSEFHVGTYALNSFLYAGIVIVFNILVNGFAGYALAKFHFPAKGFFNFIILFLIVVISSLVNILLSILEDLMLIHGILL